MSNRGRVVWHDLNTSDIDGARRFYGELFGWNIASHGQWSFIAPAGEAQHFGTMIQHDPEEKIPPHWLPYLTVTDLDAALAKVPAAGGKILVGKMPAGSTGHFSYVADPQGAVFALWQYADSPGKPEVDGAPPAGHFCWDELLTSDPAAATKFYGELIGYASESSSVPGMEYTLWLRDAKRPDGKRRQAAGLMKLPPGMPQSCWISYVAVASCDQTAERARSLGAQVVFGPQSIPDVGRIATLLDPSGAAIAIISST